MNAMMIKTLVPRGIAIPRGAVIAGLLFALGARLAQRLYALGGGLVRLLFAVPSARPLTRTEEAEQVRELARRVRSHDRSFADDLYAAAERHELGE